MYPVVIGNGRSTTSDTVIGGYCVPKGVRENANLNLTVQNEYNANDINGNLNLNINYT